MKTLLFTLEYPPFRGGIANYYGSLVKYWLSPEPDGIEALNNNEGRLINNRLPLLKWLPAYFALRQKIKQKKFDQILVGQILPLGTVALINSKFHRTKYSLILHGLDFTRAIKSGRKKFVSRLILAGAEKIICANNYVAEMVKQAFPAAGHKIIVVHPGVENNYELKITNYESLINKYNLHNKIILLSVGRLIKRKGFDKVIEAMPKILKQVPNLIYVIIGDGEELKNYELRIKNYELKNNVLIINQATDEERDSWYNLCDIFIMPARNIDGDFEGFGMVYLEANLAGKPVIAGRSGGVGDAVKDGLNGLLVNPESINDISDKIINLALNPESRHKLGEQGRERAINEFNWEKQINKIYSAII